MATIIKLNTFSNEYDKGKGNYQEIIVKMGRIGHRILCSKEFAKILEQYMPPTEEEIKYQEKLDLYERTGEWELTNEEQKKMEEEMQKQTDEDMEKLEKQRLSNEFDELYGEAKRMGYYQEDYPEYNTLIIN